MFRIVWQYDRSRMGALDATEVPAAPLALRRNDPLFADVPLVGAPDAVFAPPAVTLRARLRALPVWLRADPVHDLAAYHHAFVRQREHAELLRERLLGEPGVAYAEIQPRLAPAFFFDERRRSRVARQRTRVEGLSLTPGITEDYEAAQGHLDAAPEGVDARHAWTVPGGLGAGGRVSVVETGWNFQHEDLREHETGLVYGANWAWRDHGTAVLGILGGDRNGLGVVGIVPEAATAAYSVTWDGADGKWNAAEAIRAAADRSAPGDVILLELHAPGPNATADPESQQGFVPAEYWQDAFAATAYATALGVHVVAVAGNGGENLDAPVYGGRFSRGQRDSGAILVGGGGSGRQPDARARIWWSNFGSRLDLQGWGEDVVTTGGREDHPSYHDLRDDPDPSRCYTQSFGGTSAAAPIVAGAVSAIAGCLRAAGRRPLAPAEMRDLLVRTGTPQAGAFPHAQPIGPLPDLRAALTELGLPARAVG